LGGGRLKWGTVNKRKGLLHSNYDQRLKNDTTKKRSRKGKIVSSMRRVPAEDVSRQGKKGKFLEERHEFQDIWKEESSGRVPTYYGVIGRGGWGVPLILGPHLRKDKSSSGRKESWGGSWPRVPDYCGLSEGTARWGGAGKEVGGNNFRQEPTESGFVAIQSLTIS